MVHVSLVDLALIIPIALGVAFLLWFLWHLVLESRHWR